MLQGFCNPDGNKWSLVCWEYSTWKAQKGYGQKEPWKAVKHLPPCLSTSTTDTDQTAATAMGEVDRTKLLQPWIHTCPETPQALPCVGVRIEWTAHSREESLPLPGGSEELKLFVSYLKLFMVGFLEASFGLETSSAWWWLHLLLQRGTWKPPADKVLCLKQFLSLRASF